MPPPSRLALIAPQAIIPMPGDTLLRHAGIVIDEETGLIAALGPLPELHQRFPDLKSQHFPGLMLPGLVNAHTHLELGYQRNLIPPPSHFTAWIAALMKNYPPPDQLAAAVTQAVRAGAAESLAAGATTLGDISRHSSITRRELSPGPLRVISYGEVLALGKMRHRLEPLLEIAANPAFASPRLTIALSPHAPYTVEGPALAAIIRRALSQKLPLAMHLAELADESPFLRDLSGPLGRDWQLMLNMDILDAAIPLSPHGPLHWAKQYGLLGEAAAASQIPVLLAHVNYASPDEIALLAQSHASVAYCPRTHAYFNHPPHPYRQMLAAGVNVCLGTDSLASNPDLNILSEAKLLHDRDALDPLTALEMITWRAAQALGQPTGRLAENRPADLVIMPLEILPTDTAPTLLARLLRQTPAPAALWIAAERVL